ncbi:hypothetical protein POM88_009199 [Heracleum sosnowskyi]|uniref:AIPP2-like SPOC-like domain-containing protein n=1 Tax=Heracleum sosnowskyi TaxID=360622 RepID=A0AAD8J8Z4_9APIA|nr:hypothetical protein POM88_009199 [Heracleum sosnowskyi]
MGKMKKKRRLEEVYNATLEIKQPEITPVLSGNYPMQGPVPVEMDDEIKMASFQVNKGVGSSGRSQKSEARVGSGTCNMCSTPCSSCFHNNQAIIRSKSGEFSSETYRDNVYNFSKLAPTLKSRKCETGQHSASEASIVITMNSSPDSFSENAESKATLWNVELSSKLSSGVSTTENQDKFELHKLESDSLENNLKDFRDFEGHDENISCISGADGVTTVSSADSRTVETKSLPTSAASTNSLVSKDNVKVVSSEAAQCLQNLDVEGSKFFTKSKCNDIATREVCPPVCFPDHLHDSRLLENTLLEDTYDAAGSDMKLGVVGVNPKPEMEKCVKLEAKDDAITAGLATEALISLQHILEVEKVGELLGLPVAKETSIQSRPTEALNSTEQNHVNNESDILEHDQVCDTCGDIGREYLLVVCCRCSDGAEHTYCMPKMLDKIPEGGWMCQECKMEERKSQDNDNCDEVGGVAHKFSVHVNAKISHRCDKSGGKDTYSETNKINKDSSCVKLPCKRNEDNVKKGSSKAKEQALEPTVTSPKNSLDRVGLHLHSSSFKNSDRDGSKLARKLHSVGYSLADTKGTEAPTLGTRLPKPRGTLSKSNSFSAAHTKPKSKLVDEVFRKQKSMQNLALPHGKEGSSRVMGKSASSRSLDPDRLRFDESKAKMLPLKFSHSRDLAGFKHAKEQNFAKRKSSFEFEHSVASSPIASSTIFPRRVDQPPVSGSELVCITNKREPKTVLTDGKLEPPMPVNNAIWAMEEPVLYGDRKKHLPCFSSTIGNYAEQKPVHARMKDAETKSDSCRKRGDAKLLASDVLTARNSKEVEGKCNKLKAETEAAQSKNTGSYRNDKVLGVSTLNSKCEVSSYNELSSSSNARRLVADDKVLKEGRDLNTNSTKQPTSTSAEAVNSRIVDSLPNLPIDRIPNLMDFPNQAFKETSSHLTNSALPEYEYIWQGCFEVHKSGKLPDIYDGFQAHLSTCASPRVIETMNIFPHKVLLNEVPRLSTWPIQFVETGVREAHIGLYFFAQDYESYVKCYKNMVVRMMKDDLALKGNIDGAEILIFPSNQLPEKSQCWNMMFFLWGVFKEKRVACQQQGNGSWMKVSSPHDIPKAIMSSPESILSLVPIDKEELVSHMEVVSDALANLPHLLTAGTSCETDSLPAFQKVTCSNLTVEQPEHILECNSLSSIPKCLSQSWPEVGSTPGSKTVGIAGSLFPLDPFVVKNVHVGGTSILSNGERLHQERVPNLELALGTEVISTKKRTQDHALVRESTETEEDIPAALSLSLSFPFTDDSFVNGTAPICRGTC